MSTKYILVLLLLACPGIAQSRQDTRSVQDVIAGLNAARNKHDLKAIAQLFDPEGELIFGGIVLKGPDAIAAALNPTSKIWSEMAPPAIIQESILFLSADATLVEAAHVQVGATFLNRVPARMVLKKTANGWRIVSLIIFDSAGARAPNF